LALEKVLPFWSTRENGGAVSPTAKWSEEEVTLGVLPGSGAKAEAEPRTRDARRALRNIMVNDKRMSTTTRIFETRKNVRLEAERQVWFGGCPSRHSSFTVK
jgi:hypothetical protein